MHLVLFGRRVFSSPTLYNVVITAWSALNTYCCNATASAYKPQQAELAGTGVAKHGLRRLRMELFQVYAHFVVTNGKQHDFKSLTWLAMNMTN
jgi:hypothetical protein